ncbi:SHOCT domain-containing protein [Levilactobacillus suantsaii]|nr:SHOCT domain-containing protein [Levilactobacillus suantsaii]
MNNKIGCFGWAVIIFVLALAITYWYIVVPIAAIVGGLYYWYHKQSTPKRAQRAQDHETQLKALKTMSLLPIDESDSTGVILKSTELPYFKSTTTVNWEEERTHTTRFNYSGVTSHVKLMQGVYWRSGSVKPMNEQTTQLEIIHTGTVLLTNQRLIVLAADGRVKQVLYSGIANVVPYADGVGVMKTRGKDVYLTGDIDGEQLAIYLIRLITGDVAAHPDATLIESEPTSEAANLVEPDATEDAALVPEFPADDPALPPLTVKDIFDLTKTSSDMPVRLDETHKFYDFQSDDLDIKEYAEAYHTNPEETRKMAEQLLDELMDLSQEINTATKTTDYTFRQYIGKPDFELLFAQVKNNHVDYFLFDDPKFIQIAKEAVPEQTSSDQPLTDATTGPAQPATDLAAELRQLKQLVDEDVLTPEEFKAKKKQLLGI